MILYGASGHARVIRDIIETQGNIVEYMIDDNKSLTSFDNLCVNHSFPLNFDINLQPIIISIGSNRARMAVANRIRRQFADIFFGRAVHPSAIVSPSATIGEGTVVMQGAIIQAAACIGDHCIINTGSSVDHECKIGNFAHVSPHATLCGNVNIGEGTWIGAGSTVIQGVSVGRWTIVGAGSVVTHDIPDNCLAVGTPCKPIRLNINNIPNGGGG